MKVMGKREKIFEDLGQGVIMRTLCKLKNPSLSHKLVYLLNKQDSLLLELSYELNHKFNKCWRFAQH